MVTVTIQDQQLHLNVEGIHKILSLRSELVIPIQHVRGVTHDPGAIEMPKGLRAPGTSIPGFLHAGTFYKDGEKIFWDVRNAARTIVIELAGEEFNRLVVEVADPTATVSWIEKALSDSRG